MRKHHFTRYGTHLPLMLCHLPVLHGRSTHMRERVTGGTFPAPALLARGTSTTNPRTDVQWSSGCHDHSRQGKRDLSERGLIYSIARTVRSAHAHSPSSGIA
jgi:hypothetical protein